MNYLPKFPLHLNSIALLGITLLLGLIGGEFAKRIRFLPQISGYILVGFIMGSEGFNIINQSILTNTNIFIDISLSLILFELGRHLDFTWLRHDPSILCMSLMEAALTFFLVFSVLYVFAHMPLIQSSLAATIAIATSPAVVMMIANDLTAEGPVTRRALILTSLNNLYTLILFILLAPLTKADIAYNTFTFSMYRLFGSILLGISIFIIANTIARLIGKHRPNQFVLFAGAALLALGMAHALKLSSMLTLFILGVSARNFDYKHHMMEINFAWLARMFFILLFVAIGVHLKLQGLVEATWIVLAFVFARAISKMIGIGIFSNYSQLTQRQSFALSLALFPMAGIAIGMSNILIDFNSDFGNKLLVIITAVVAILNLIGPIATQFAFMMTGESINGQNNKDV